MASTFGIKIRSRDTRTLSVSDANTPEVAEAYGVRVDDYETLEIAEAVFEQAVINHILKKIIHYRKRKLAENPDISDLIVEI